MTALSPTFSVISEAQELLLHIFAYLSEEDLAVVQRVCQLFKSVSEDRSLWRPVGHKWHLRRCSRQHWYEAVRLACLSYTRFFAKYFEELKEGERLSLWAQKIKTDQYLQTKRQKELFAPLELLIESSGDSAPFLTMVVEYKKTGIYLDEHTLLNFIKQTSIDAKRVLILMSLLVKHTATRNDVLKILCSLFVFQGFSIESEKMFFANATFEEMVQWLLDIYRAGRIKDPVASLNDLIASCIVREEESDTPLLTMALYLTLPVRLTLWIFDVLQATRHLANFYREKYSVTQAY